MPGLILTLAAAASATLPSTILAERFEQWERRLRARVESLHVIQPVQNRIPPCDVIVGLSVGDSGTPRDIEIRKSSCGLYYEKNAIAVARGLGRIGAVPGSSGDRRRVLLKLSYGSHPDAAADRGLSAALDAERADSSRRNLALIAKRDDSLAAAVGQLQKR